MELCVRKSRQVFVFFILLFFLSIPIVYSEENSNFKIVNLNIDVDIDAGGLSLVTERMILSNTSPEEINSIEMDISGSVIWNLRAFEDENRILPSFARKIDFMTYEIKIDVNLKSGEMKTIWLQYLVDLDIISEKYEDFQYVNIRYNFSESKYLGDSKYPLSIRFWAPTEFSVATDAGAYVSDEIGSPFNERQGTFENRDYIFLIFEKKPEQKSIMVILRNKREIDRFNSELEETLDFSGSTPTMKIAGTSISCIRLYPYFFILLPYRGKNHKVIPEDLFEIRSDSYYSWLAPRDNVRYLRVGYPLDYYVEYDMDDMNLRNPFFTVVSRDISEIGSYKLTLFLKRKPFFIYNAPPIGRIGNAYIRGNWNEYEGKYEIWIYDNRKLYLERADYTIAFMTGKQLEFDLEILLLITLLLLFLLAIKGFVGLNKDFLSYILFFPNSLCVMLFITFPLFDSLQNSNIISYFLLLYIAFTIFFLYILFSKNLSFRFGVVLGVAFLFTNYGTFIGQIVSKIYFLALDRNAVGALILSTVSPVLLILYYLHREKKIQVTVRYLYRKIKILGLNVPIIAFLPMFGFIGYLIYKSPFITRLIFSFVLFVIFFLLSGFEFFSTIRNSKYRKKNGYYLYEGVVTKIEKQESEVIHFHLQYFSDDDNEGVFSMRESEFIYNNQVNYPIFGLSFSRVKEEMKLIVITRNSHNRDGILPLEAWIITPSRCRT